MRFEISLGVLSGNSPRLTALTSLSGSEPSKRLNGLDIQRSTKEPFAFKLFCQDAEVFRLEMSVIGFLVSICRFISFFQTMMKDFASYKFPLVQWHFLSPHHTARKSGTSTTRHCQQCNTPLGRYLIKWTYDFALLAGDFLGNISQKLFDLERGTWSALLGHGNCNPSLTRASFPATGVMMATTWISDDMTKCFNLI